MTRPLHRLAVVAAALLLAPRLLPGQERGATALGEAVAGLDVTPRVLLIAAHPDDEDTQLIAWLRRGRQVETGYLSLTRGDGGQNLIGNELGPLLGMIRTEELLAARRIDGGRQFFTRAYDFGFSKSAEETYTHWPKDSILRDMVTIVRAFRPQIIVGVFSGTPRDGHGHHQVSGQLAREVFDAAADTVRFPRSMSLGLGPWSPSKFYRAARFNPQEATVSFNVGELSPYRGMTYAEIASLSRSQHLSQGFGVLQRHGTSLDYLKLEASRVSPPIMPERSPLEVIPSGWERFANASLTPEGRAALDSLPAAIAQVRSVENLVAPAPMIVPLARVARLVATAQKGLRCSSRPCIREATYADAPTGDLAVSLETARRRANAALLAAAGVLVEATAPRELIAVGDTMPVTVSVYNQGPVPVKLVSADVSTSVSFESVVKGNVEIAPDSSGHLEVPLHPEAAIGPWWLEMGRRGDVFLLPGAGSSSAMNVAVGEDRIATSYASVGLEIDGARIMVDAGPIVYRMADPARGEVRRPVTAVRAIGLEFGAELQYARANVPLDRAVKVRVQSASGVPQSVAVTLTLPKGLSADSLTRHVALQPFSEATLTYRVRGTVAEGRQYISATAVSGGRQFMDGWHLVEYAHIRPMRYFQVAAMVLQVVDAKLPRVARIAYVPGVGDNVAAHLGELGMQVTTLAPDELATADLSKFGAVVLGPRAFAATPALAAQSPKLQAFARAGGTVVVQYGQNEMQVPGILPYPITLSRLAERVTDEHAPVRVLDSASALLNLPNRISTTDFDKWEQERAVYMPTSADPHWRHLLEMHDPGAPPNENAVLVAPVGKGAYVYTTLALFRQIPAGVPGGVRILLNLIAADARAAAPTGMRP